MRTETAKTLEEASRLHQYAQERVQAFRKEFAGVSPLYESNLSHSIVAGLRDAYRRIFEEGYFGRTIHDVVSYYNNDPDKAKRGDDLQKQNDKGMQRSDNQGMEM
jgi:hypothetical protein